jgi:cellulose synthase operon protein YhjU
MNKNTTPSPTISLRWWNVYFILKIILILQNAIKFSLLYNLAFIVFILFPIRHAKLRIVREVIAVGIGISLFYYDSYFPPFKHLLTQANQLIHFDLAYIFELFGRFISIDFLLLIGIICFTFYMVNKVLRVTTFVICALLYIGISGATLQSSNSVVVAQTTNSVNKNISPELNNSEPSTSIDLTKAGLNNYLQQFFQEEETKVSKLNLLTKADLNHANFDILLVSICSIGWDDLALTNEINHPLLSEFDIRFDNYNSATAYSGPALVRLLRANCGQEPHSALFDAPKNNQCLLFEQLDSLGFNSEMVLNHDGEFDDFTQQLKQNMSKDVIQPVPLKGFSPYIRGFDGSNIYRDIDVLTAWSETAATGKSITLYNSISAHDGNNIINSNASGHLAKYHEREENILDDIDQFFKQLTASKRNIVVVFVPEHGAAMRGDHMQIQGMREIPTPAITHIPVGIKLFGEGLKLTNSPLIVNDNVSHLAISDVLANIITSNIYNGKTVSTANLVDNIDHVQAISQNSGATMMKVNDKSFLSLNEGDWIEYSDQSE